MKSCHFRGMKRIRVSSPVDVDLLHGARALKVWRNDAAMIDSALRAVLAEERAVQINASYVAYDEQPLDTPDAWGDLASFRVAVADRA